MIKPELLVTPTSVENVEEVIDAGADAVMIGEERYGLRLAGEFDRTAVHEAVKLAHERGVKVYVAMNALFHNDTLPELPDYLAFLDKIGADAVVFGDPAVLMNAKQYAPKVELHWNTETTATNWYTANYWGRKGSARAVLARELNMDSVIEIKENAEVAIEVQVHGMTCMFQSKRTLVGNYMEFQGKDLGVEGRSKDRTLVLHDPERDVKYPIWEDWNGTHIMSPKDMCIIDELDELIDAEIDSFKIDGVLKDGAYIRDMTGLYRQAIDQYAAKPEEYIEEKEAWRDRALALQPDNRELDTGFFFKETVY
ncbi:peptidase U32 family protein [Salisediminibacterium halotolerans]|uniref:Protease n=1 Tax=Salisediminibacterium halotolerans TaxID=517425 RepID=A0A1H9VA38_9BACI|nr:MULTISPECIES: peptidase U32 family protein [Salisediminibacterium]RLJ78353.1 putative protease [Actinophytocola xinjiangensis]RPE88305.1 putative protease [Salisediminibacterium halotolerans]TWG37329.1 putative protease [Salisediminibacterium halotolerans]SES18449.1 putative protease [Salisediminibacterium haloalkalitolerans]GEL06794.1 putative protease YrrN [Salisediminibacterium halotolerans]